VVSGSSDNHTLPSQVRNSGWLAYFEGPRDNSLRSGSSPFIDFLFPGPKS
jgi:hypothetical protein